MRTLSPAKYTWELLTNYLVNDLNHGYRRYLVPSVLAIGTTATTVPVEPTPIIATVTRPI